MIPAENYAGAPLCGASAIPDGGAREIFVGPQDDPLHVVLFRQGETVLAYRNMCPHFLLPLNAGPGRFIMLKDGLVMCAWHSAVVLQAVSRVSAACAWPMARMALTTGASRKRVGRKVLVRRGWCWGDGMVVCLLTSRAAGGGLVRE